MTHNSRLKAHGSWLTCAPLVIAVMASGAGMPGAASAATGFGAELVYGTGSGPGSVVAGDFNGDGNLDLAVANFGSNTVSILLGNGNGTFQTQVPYGTGTNPISVTAGDFNGDGNVDLAVANLNSTTVSILLGNGNGTFHAKVDYGTGTTPVSVTTGDFNGDGNLDLAVANEFGPTVSILLGNGDGTFQAKVDYGTGTQPESVTTGDFNGDGNLDLAVANQSSNTVSILLGNGNGTFQTRVDYGTGSAPHSVSTGDFNGDGTLDLATANRTDNTVSILLGNGNGTFQAKVDYGTGSDPVSVATGDFNADGNLDLAVANYGNGAVNTVSVLLGNGDGAFQGKVDYVADIHPVSVIAANLHSRGTFDLAVSNVGANDVSVLLNNAPSPLPLEKSSTMQYTLTGSNGTTWMLMDTARLQQRMVPACTCRATLTANSSLWTNTANLNQDIGLEVSGGKYGPYPGTLVAWEESGSGSNLFSPNAATVTKKIDAQSGVAYTVTVVWKSNHSTASGQIWAAGGPAGGPYSPTTLRVDMPERP